MKIRVFEICCSLKPEKWQMQRTSVVNTGMRLIKVKVKSTSQSQHGIHGIHYAPPTEGGGHIVFGVDPVGVCVRVASFRRNIF